MFVIFILLIVHLFRDLKGNDEIWREVMRNDEIWKMTRFYEKWRDLAIDFTRKKDFTRNDEIWWDSTRNDKMEMTWFDEIWPCLAKKDKEGREMTMWFNKIW